VKSKLLTEKKALQLTQKLWSWLARHPKRVVKEAWPGWQKIGEYAYDCPCCEFVTQQYVLETSNEVTYGNFPNRACLKCPLLTLWNGDFSLSRRPCTQADSPYSRWNTASMRDPETRAKAAKQIADGAKKRLKELKCTS